MFLDSRARGSLRSAGAASAGANIFVLIEAGCHDDGSAFLLAVLDTPGPHHSQG